MMVDDMHMDTVHMWTRYMAFPYMAAMSPAMGTYFAGLQARLQAQPAVSNLEQLSQP